MKTQQRLGSDMRPRGCQSHALTTQPTTQNISEKLARKEAKNKCYERFNASDSFYSKSASKYVEIFNENLSLIVNLEKEEGSYQYN